MANTKKTPLLPAYLAVGEDALKRETVIRRLRMRVEQQVSEMSFNHDRFNGETATGEAIVDACNTLPFMSDLRLVEVSHVEKMKKATSEAICAYLEAPNASTVLALDAESLAKNTRLYKHVAALGKQAIIDCTPMKKAKLENAVREMAVSQGFTMTPAAAQKLIELVGEDTVLLDSEIKKLALAHHGIDPVNDREVEQMVAHVSEYKPWDFTDAFSERNLNKCLHVLNHLPPSLSPYVLMTQCTKRLRELICVKSLEERGELNRLSAELNIKANWIAEKRIVWAKQYSTQELVDAIVSARDTDQAMKSGADPKTAFYNWMVSVVTRK